MLSEALTDPAIFAFVCAEDDDEVVAGSVVGVEEVGYYAEEADAAGEDYEFVFFAKFAEDVLLEILGRRGVSGGDLR
jgi:hypothetical protein